VPLDYGASTCDAWNQNNIAFALSCDCPNPEDWCGSRWCFIDPTYCSRKDFRTSDIEGLELHQSYTTCNNQETYIFENLFSELKGSTLRVGYPPDIDSVLHIFTRPAGYKDGAAVQFMFNIIEEQSNFSITLMRFWQQMEGYA